MAVFPLYECFQDYSWIQEFEADFVQKVSLKLLNLGDYTFWFIFSMSWQIFLCSALIRECFQDYSWIQKFEAEFPWKVSKYWIAEIIIGSLNYFQYVLAVFLCSALMGQCFQDYSWIQDFEVDFPQSLKVLNWGDYNSFSDLFSVCPMTNGHLNWKLVLFCRHCKF